jgi:cytochrome P450
MSICNLSEGDQQITYAFFAIARLNGQFRIAGSETSSTAMTHTLMYLVENPRTLKRLCEELDQATACSPPGSVPRYDQVRNLPYLTACINESMRLRPVAATGELTFTKEVAMFDLFLTLL